LKPSLKPGVQPRRVLTALGAIAALTAVCASAPAFADPKFPDSPIRIIVPFAPGGGVDRAARVVGKQMQDHLKVAVFIDNRAGGNGAIGGKAVQIAPADGYTLLFSAATHVLARQVMATPPYDPQADFAAVARVGEAPLLVAITPTLPQARLGEVISAARREPDKWTAAIPALGAPSHLATLLLAKQGGFKLTTASYKGTAPASVDVAGGHAQLIVDSIISLQPLAKGGKLKAIATTSSKRSGVMPEVPTAAESGYPGLVYASWYGFWAPKGTPEERVRLLNKAINEAVAEVTRNGEFASLGIDAVSDSPEGFRKYVAGYVAQSAELLKEAGFKPE